MLLDPCVKRAEKYSKSTILQTMFDQTGYPWGNTPELWKSYVSSSLSASVSFPFQYNVMPGATRGSCCACSCCGSRGSSRKGPVWLLKHVLWWIMNTDGHNMKQQGDIFIYLYFYLCIYFCICIRSEMQIYMNISGHPDTWHRTPNTGHRLDMVGHGF